jgi:inorganic pyrophosphatase
MLTTLCCSMMNLVTVIVESPKGSGHKFNYEPQTGRFKLSKILPAGLVFPFDFGFIPDTKGEDGDPLDVIVISEISTFPGCAMDCYLIGVFEVEQTERDGKTMRNDRFLAVPGVSQLFSEVKDINDMPDAILNQLEHFFKNYNEQAGKKFEVLKRAGAAAAHKLIKK